MARIDAKNKKPVASLAKLDGYFSRPSISSAGMMPYELLAEVLTAAGRKNDLIPRLEKLYQTNPRDVALGYFLASSYRQAGRLKLAEDQYRKLIEKTTAGRRVHRPGGYLFPPKKGVRITADPKRLCGPIGGHGSRRVRRSCQIHRKRRQVARCDGPSRRQRRARQSNHTPGDRSGHDLCRRRAVGTRPSDISRCRSMPRVRRNQTSCGPGRWI